jgi:hypothetical protein
MRELDVQVKPKRRESWRRRGWAKEGGEKAVGPENREEEDFHFLFLF